MKINSLKLLFLLLCIFKIALTKYEEFDLDTSTSIKANGDKTFQINLKSDKNYIGITLKSGDNSTNPMIFVSSSDEKCVNDRLYIGVQIIEPILIFLKKSQIKNKKFYICVHFREQSLNSYQIILKNEDKAYIPFNSQVSYYVLDENNSEMNFIFQKDSSLNNKKVSFSIRGRDIQITNVLNNFEKLELDSGYIYYGDYINQDITFNLKANIGDYITIGSTIISQNKLDFELKENANEIVIASKEEVCIPITFGSEYISHITGKIYVHNALSFFKYENETIIEKEGITGTRITNGIISEMNIGMLYLELKNMKGFYCLKSLINKYPLIAFAIQMTSNKNIQIIHPPLFPGEIRRHFLMKNEFAIFYGMKPQEDATEVNLNLKALKGFPEMYYDKCATFPDCSYTKESINNKNLIHPYPSNMMTVYSFYMDEDDEYKKYNPFTSFQPLMIVYCGPGGKNEHFGESSFCEFETSFFTNKDTINIYQDSSFTQYLLINEEDEYKIHTSIGSANKLYLDMLLFSGDADIVIENCPLKCNKYYLSNKIFYSIHLPEDSDELLFKFKVVANDNVFYMIQYKLIDSNGIEENTLESGINHIIPQYIYSESSDTTKRLNLINYKAEFRQPYLATFFSPNCKFSLRQGSSKPITIFDNTAQIILNTSNTDYNKGLYKFDVSIDEESSSENKKTYCMLYVSGLELSQRRNDEWNRRSISLSEGVPHRYTFSRHYNVIFYAYHISNIDKTVVLNFNLIDKAYFNISINIGREFLRKETIYRNSQLYITSNDLYGKCEEQEVCTIIVFVDLFNSQRQRTIELTIYQIDNNPFYLEKNAIKQDVLHGNNAKHYYSDIGKGDYGDITLDFKRGSGNIYASVVKRILDKPMDNPDWRGLYHFPTNKDKDTLRFRAYSKKIILEKENTKECDDGCYLLISIYSNIIYNEQSEGLLTPFRISINPRILNQESLTGIPLVRMYVNEFVIGDIDFASSDERKYDYYIATLPYESEYIIFDWQADSPSLLVNVGNTRPEIGKSDFRFPQSNHDFVYKLTKDEILNKTGSIINSLRGLDLTIGIYSNSSDSLQVSPYAFKIFMPPTLDKEFHISNEIIHIRSDQKVQCIPFDYNNTKICVFAVIFDDLDIDHSLIIYPRSHKGTPLNIYGAFVDSEKIERNDNNEIMRIMGTIFLKIDYQINENYIHLEKIEDKTKCYLFITEVDDYGSIIEVLSSSYSYHNGMDIYPNPSTAQLFELNDNNINLNFVTTKGLLINLVCISGTGSFYWDTTEEKNQKYYLSGFNNRISLISATEEGKISKLNANNILNDINSRFIFYLTFYPRSDLDQIKTETSTQIYYREGKIPLSFYTQIDLQSSWLINFNFYDYDINISGESQYDKKLFNIWATILSNEDILKTRFDPNFKPKYDEKLCIKGVYDTSFGSLFLNLKDIEDIYNQTKSKEINLENPDFPNIFLNIETDRFKTGYMNLELGIISYNESNIYNFVQEKVYISGKITDSINKKFIYMLYTDKTRPYFSIEFSTNYNFIKFAISVDPESEVSDSFSNMNMIHECGKIILNFELDKEFFLSKEKLYLIVFTKEDIYNQQLGYYIFKYSASKELKTSSIENYCTEEINVIKNDNEYQITFSPIAKDEKIDSFIYYIKAVYKSSFVEDENIDTISISESEGVFLELDNPEIDSNNKIIGKFQSNEDFIYIKILAKINYLDEKIYYLYKPYEYIEKRSDINYYNKTESLILINYDYSSNYVQAYVNEAYKIQKYWLIYAEGFKNTLSQSYLPKYINIKVTHKDKSKPSPIIDFFHSDNNGDDIRLQLSKGGADYTDMWIKREEFISIGLYFKVECFEEYNCGYSIEIKGYEEIILNNNRAYSYYIRDDNKKMKYKFINDFNNEESRMTIYATGDKEIYFNDFNCYGNDVNAKISEYNNGIITLIAFGVFDYCEIEISAQANDIITVGGKSISEQRICTKDILHYYNPLIIGFFDRGILENECYNLPQDQNDIYYISGTFYDKIGEITFTDENLELIETYPKKEQFFSFIYNPSKKNITYICISLQAPVIISEEISTYSIRLQSKNHFHNAYNPQITSIFYPRLIPTDTFAYFTYKSQQFSSSNRVIFNMVSLEGYPKMFLYKCKTYPSCNLDFAILEQNEDVERIAEINRVSSSLFPIKVGTPLDKEQNILIVKCNNAKHKKYDYCKFMTLIFENKQEIILKESQPFGEYILKNEDNMFSIDFSQEKEGKKIIKKIFIDVLVVNGDISLEFKNPDNYDEDIIMNNYYLANKIFYTITLNSTVNTNLEKIYIKVNAKVNSYYNIEYRLIYSESDETHNYIYSSNNYLLPIFINNNNLSEDKKNITINHINIIKPKSFIVNFYSLNCEIDVYKNNNNQEEDEGKEYLYSLANYAQDFFVIETQEAEEEEEDYDIDYNKYLNTEYSIEVKNRDSTYIKEKNICMVYVSALEIYEKNSGIRKEILVSEGVPQRVIFETDLDIMRYIFAHNDPNKNLVININMIVKGKFRIKIFFREQLYNQDEVISRSTYILIKKEWIQNKCKENELCTMTIQIDKIENFYDSNPIIEMIIKQTENDPYYIPKGIMKKDFLSGENYLRIYTDIGKNEGYITVNFYRGSGYIYAKVVPIYIATSEEGADWRNYRFPDESDKDTSLKYDFYNKKILIKENDVEHCDLGCYVLISIKTSVIEDEPLTNKFQPFSIITEFSPKDYINKGKFQRKIIIDPDEYVIGSLYEEDDINKEGIYEYYTITIPFDSSGIEIDWQSDAAILLINVGQVNPEETADFNYYERRDTNIFISKTEILNAFGGVEGQSLQGIDLVFGIYTQYYNSIYSTVYSFRVHFPRAELNIYKINSDHKTICKPEQYDYLYYNCLFMIPYESYEIFNDLIVYAKSQSPSAIINMYGNEIDSEIYNSYDITELKKNIPNEINSKYNPQKEKKNFIFLNYIENNKNLFISVISSNNAMIELYTSMKTFEDKLSPNPSSAQIYSLDVSNSKLELDFITTKSFSVNILSLHGEANIYLKENSGTKYYLRGVDDSVDLIIPTNYETSNTLLVIENLGTLKENYTNPGFAFILEYHLRSIELNIDKIDLYETKEISFKDIDFPIYFYSKIIFDDDNNNNKKSINVFFNLHNSILSEEEYFNRKILPNELIIKGTILDETQIYEIQKDSSKKPELNEMEIEGIYDSVLQAGNIIFSKEFINSKYNIDKPTLFLAIEKGDNTETFGYKNIRGEIGITTLNGDSPVTQKLYQFGKVKNYRCINSYKLKSDANNKYMRIQFSANSKYVNFAINEKPDTRINMTLIDLIYKNERGITFITFKKPEKLDYIYINIFLAQDSSDDKLNNYVFKYINGDNLDQFYEYNIINNNPKITIQKGNKNIKATINQIDINNSDNYQEKSIIYILKLYTSNYISQENINMISISESDTISKQFNHISGSNQITLDFDYGQSSYKYAQVIARITSGPIIEYISYQAIDFNGNYINDPEPIDIIIPKPVMYYQDIKFDDLTEPIMGNNDTSYHIILSNKNYKNYFYIRLNSFDTNNPYVFISDTDKDCNNDRLYITNQEIDSIIIFLKKEQIHNKEFYICVKNKKDLFEYNYEIVIENDNQALIPLFSQTSYLVTKDNINMEFVYKDEYMLKLNNLKEDKDIINFWVKGKNIKTEINSDSGLKELNYDGVNIYYGERKSNEYILKIEGRIGDYITVGINGINYAINENQNELIMASEDEVCLSISSNTNYLMHITGQIYTRKATTYFKDSNGNKIDSTEQRINNGIINDINNIAILFEYSRGYYCLKNNNHRNHTIAFAIQMTSNRNLQMVHPPLYPGEIRRHFLMKDEIAIFYSMKPEDGVNEVNLNLKALKGFPEMYFDDCATFPLCTYTKESMEDEKLIHPYPSNMMTVYSFYMNENENYKNYNPITTFQPLMIIYCGKGGKIQDYINEDLFCEFETSFFSNKDTINIYEDNPFSQYLLKDEEDNYKIILDRENIHKIYLDLLIFSGDVNIELNKDFEKESNKYYLSNKIFYSIHISPNNQRKNLEFKVKANLNSFYMIQYKLINNDNEDINTIESGVNYITSKYLDKNSNILSKRIELINYKVEFGQSYLATFYSPNCKFGLKWMNESQEIEQITMYDNFAQKIIKSSDNYYSQNKYSFEYNILFDDDSDYNKKFCMIYASGLELSESQLEWNERSISLSEGVPHRCIFNEDNHFVSYAYHVSDINNTVVINFNLIDKDYFTINLSINKKSLKSDTSRIYRNSQLYIYKDELNSFCYPEEVCTIIIGVQLENYKRDRKIEITAYQIDDNPFYLEKNTIKQDIVHGNKVKHYYFDVGKDDYGDITLDFKRGSGNIYVSVEKRLLDKPMDYPEWRGLYHFPMTIDESLKYDTYVKKVFIDLYDTEKCEDGCYVLISIINNIQYTDNDTIPYRMSINTKIMKGNTIKEIPKVKMDVNEFVIGEIDSFHDDYQIYDYYLVTLPYDSPYLLIDWQADSPRFVINVGTFRPEKGKAHIELNTLGHDYVYKIEGYDIWKYTDNSTLRGVNLTIGIYSEYSDSLKSSPYAFKLFMPPVVEEGLKLTAEIIHIRSDQKVQCYPFNYKNTNICAFAVIFDDFDINNKLILYPRSEYSHLVMYGKEMDAMLIERNNQEEIMNTMQDLYLNEKYKITKKYIYLDKINSGKSYVFIVSEDDAEHIIEILSSTYQFHEDMSVYPNPSSAQIFAIEDYKINLNFVTTNDLLINIASISGLGNFYWGNVIPGTEKKYYLNDEDDRLSLTTLTDDDERKLAPLVVQSLSLYNKDKKNEDGFIFYITYYPRCIMDQLKEDRNTEIHYRTVHMPLTYFAPINRLYSWSISFNLYDYTSKSNQILTYDNNLFIFWATVISNETAINAKTNEKSRPIYDSSKCINGVFDSTYGTLFISSNDVNRIYKGGSKEPNLFINIDKAIDIPDFDTLGLELSLHSDYLFDGYNYIPEGVYFNGKIGKVDTKTIIYSLHTNEEKPYIIMEYASISDKIKFILTFDDNSETMEEFDYIKTENKYGRNILIVKLNKYFFTLEKKLFLKIFTKDNNIDKKLDNYIFKYITSIDNTSPIINPFTDESKSKLNVIKENNKYIIKLYPIKYNEAEISYYIKALYKSEMINGENIDSIAISESPGKYMHVINPTHKNNEQIIFELEVSQKISYIKVMARISYNAQKYFYLYKPFDAEKEAHDDTTDITTDSSYTSDIPSTDDNKKDNTALVVSLSVVGVLLAIIIFVVILVVLYNRKHKDLMKQVNKISFVQSGANEQTDSNLLINDENELD